MNKDKLSYFTLLLFIIMITLNILIFLNIIPFAIWKISNRIMIIFFCIISFTKRKIGSQIKDKKITFLGFFLVFIIIICEGLILYKFM
jgi:hypothetical protein